LQLDAALLEPIMKRLKMYVLRSKVTISDVSDSILRMGVAGKNSEAALRKIFEKVPQQPHELVSLENGVILRLPGPIPRFQVFSPIEHAPAIWQQLKQDHPPAGEACWEWLEIQAGIPDVVPATQEAFVPQMVNLDALEGINFKKGCYTGQEIVARTHYLGKVKRRTQLAHIASAAQPNAGDDVQGADGNEAGKIVRSAASPQGGFDVLAEVRLESLEAGKVYWKDSELLIQQLPYRLPD
jgi:folate-binding protein YgfZ